MGVRSTAKQQIRWNNPGCCRRGFPYNADMSSSITPTAISAACRSAAAAAVTIEVVARTGSTNADLLARAGAVRVGPGAEAAGIATHDASAPLTGPTLLVALAQTAGRGRAGRAWLSDAGSLTFSLAWPCAQALTGLLGLPLAIGVTVAEVLAARQLKVELKWPNDVLLDGRKLAGILIETTAPAFGPDGGRARPRPWAVIGIGMNLLSAGEAARTVDGAIVAALPATDRNVLLAALLDALVLSLQEFEQAGLAPFVARWNALHAHAGQRVDILDQGNILHSGVALGIDAGGRLLLDTGAPGPAKVVAIVAGDVSLRVNQEGARAAAD